MPALQTQEIEQLHRAAIACFAGDTRLSTRFILRGGAALRLFYGGTRPIRDFDLTMLRAEPETVETALCEPEHSVLLLDNRLSGHLHRYYPPFHKRERWMLENLNFDVCACGEQVECTQMVLRPETGNTLLVSTKSDILASKLVEMVNAKRTLKVRPQDLLDASHLIADASHGTVDAKSTIRLAKAKAAFRKVIFEPEMFDKSIRCLATREYEDFCGKIGGKALSAASAWHLIVTFLRQA